MKLDLKIWRQSNSESKGSLHNYEIDEITPDMSFLEMMDVLNEKLILEGVDPIAFDHDCREGICGSCSLFINGRAHGPDTGITTCQLHMRKFKDGENIYIEINESNLGKSTIKITSVALQVYSWGKNQQNFEKLILA